MTQPSDFTTCLKANTKCIYVALFKNWDNGMGLCRQQFVNEKLFKPWIVLSHFHFHRV